MPDPAPLDDRSRAPALPLWLIAVGWAAIALVFATHELVSDHVNRHPSPVAMVGYWAISEWGTWALLTPLVVRLVGIVPIRPPRLASTLGAHLLLGFLFATAQVLLQYALDVAVVTATGNAHWSVTTWLAGRVDAALATLGYLMPRKLGFNYVVYWTLVAIGHLATYYRLYHARQLEASRLTSELAQARLHALTAQLRPHFLFNSLNAVSELVHENPAKADRMLGDLSALLRRAIDTDGSPLITLERELAYVDRYLAIQRIRFDDRFVVRYQIAPDAATCLVPPECLQPVVENAVGHGFGTRGGQGILEIVAQVREDRLVVTVADDGAGLAEPAREGTGLRAVRARLETAFGGEARLTLAPRQPRGTITTIDAPRRP